MSTAPTFLILGANSDIARELARGVAMRHSPMVLAGRNEANLNALATELRAEFSVKVRTAVFDVLATETHADFLDGLGELPDIVVSFVGMLGDQTLAERHFSDADLVLRTNLIGPMSILGEVANRMQARKHGGIVAVSSVAGERGRADNYIYGAAKAGLTVFLSGLRQRFGATCIRVVTIKPGRVTTKMTMGGRSFLMVAPQNIRRRLVAACLRGRGVFYLPWYWRIIMFLVRSIPEPLFRKLGRIEL